MTALKYQVTKTYTHSIGLSACFRQWRAHHSHCRFMHGYALQVKIVFESPVLDNRNWVMDFGGLKTIKNWLGSTFDHKTLVATDDPHYQQFVKLNQLGIIDMISVDAVGCEAFAKLIFDHVSNELRSGNLVAPEQTEVRYVEVREHESNSAIYGAV